MPLDYARIQGQLYDLSNQIGARLAEEHSKAAHATILLDSLTGRNADVREIVFAAAAANKSLRSAIPTDEEITAFFPPPALNLDHLLPPQNFRFLRFGGGE